MSRTPRKANFSYWNEPVLLPTEVKLQHYVPQFYLRPFADTKGQIRVTDLEPPGRQYETGVRNVAAETRFYDVDTGGATLSAETWLAELEGRAAPILERLIGDPDAVLDLSMQEEMALARFLAAFRFRTPTFPDQAEKLKQLMVASAQRAAIAYVRNKYPDAEVKRMLEAWFEHPDEWWLGEAHSAPPAVTTAGMLSEVQGLANLLRTMPWRIGRVPPEQPLYASDNLLAGLLPPLRP